MRTGTRVTEIERRNGSLVLATDPGDPLEAGLVVCATGVSPNIGFLDGAAVGARAARAAGTRPVPGSSATRGSSSITGCAPA